MPASYIIKPLWDIDWDTADFGPRSTEWHFMPTRCLTTPLCGHIHSHISLGWSLNSKGTELDNVNRLVSFCDKYKRYWQLHL